MSENDVWIGLVAMTIGGGLGLLAIRIGWAQKFWDWIDRQAARRRAHQGLPTGVFLNDRDRGDT